jgi:hypothetical protein
MIPVPSNGTETQSAYMPNAMPRLSFSEITGIPLSKSTSGDNGAATAGDQSAAAILNDAGWLSAMTNSMNAAGAFTNMVTYNDSNYTLDGQQFVVPFSNQVSAAMSGANSQDVNNFNNNANNHGLSHVQTAADSLSLDEMPGGPLDFQAWDSWFRAAGSYNVEGNNQHAGGQI